MARNHFASVLVIATLTLFAVACDDEGDDGNGTDTSTTTTEDGTTSMDVSVDEAPVELTGEDAFYRFQSLELSEPQLSLSLLLNALIQTSISLEPSEPESINILARMSEFDTAAAPIALSIEAGAGTPDLTADPVTFEFDTVNADVVKVSATYEPYTVSDDVRWKIQNTNPTNLVFPIAVQGELTPLPLRNIILDVCFGNGRSCDGTDMSKIFGTLTGGIKVSEAEEITVEFDNGVSLPLADVLRDADGAPGCEGGTACVEGRECNAAEECVRIPDSMVEGEPAFALAGRFLADRVNQ